MRYLTSCLLVLLGLIIAGSLPALAQDDPPPAEVKLTAETIKAVIAATKEMQALDPAQSGAATESGDTTELDGQLDAIAKKHGFADGEAYGQAFESAVQAYAVVDWTSEHRKQQAAGEIATINADTELTDEQKKEAVALVEQDLASPPPVATPENVELMRAHEAEMRELMSSDIGP
jgi:hypothetical protein